MSIFAVDYVLDLSYLDKYLLDENGAKSLGSIVLGQQTIMSED